MNIPTRIIRKQILEKLTSLGYEISLENNTRLEYNYFLKKDNDLIKLHIQKSRILFKFVLENDEICAKGIWFDSGSKFGYGNKHEKYPIINELIVVIIDLFNLPIPTIIL